MAQSGTSVVGLSVRGLGKAFRGTWALRGVDLDLAPGETLVLFGPNGSGKTTLLKTLAGFLRPLRGELLWFGEGGLRSRPEARRRIGYAGHETMLYEDLSAYRNLLVFAGLYGLSAPHRRVNAALEAAGLWERRDDPPRRFSRGMRARLALARAVLHGPDLLLLDEPDSGLDDRGREWLSSLLQAQRRRGGSALVATHDPQSAEAGPDAQWRLNEGVLEAAA